ncbi:MAG: hypothetical protein U9Q06_04210 [Nanoarchaeota archaeon]|nr:hypothetical protein [Nanoarchaeota archaeon]
MKKRVEILRAYLEELHLLNFINPHFHFIEEIIFDLQKTVPFLSLNYGVFTSQNRKSPSVKNDLVYLAHLISVNQSEKANLKSSIKFLLNKYSNSPSFNKIKQKHGF